MSHVHPSHRPAVSPDAIAECVLDAFDKLPEKRKPRPRNDGAREWVPLSGIVLSKGSYAVRLCRQRADPLKTAN
jgi:hypothetical protein